MAELNFLLSDHDRKLAEEIAACFRSALFTGGYEVVSHEALRGAISALDRAATKMEVATELLARIIVARGESEPTPIPGAQDGD